MQDVTEKRFRCAAVLFEFAVDLSVLVVIVRVDFPGENVLCLLLQLLRRRLLVLDEVRVLLQRVAKRVHVALGGHGPVEVLRVGHVERVDTHVVVHRHEERDVGEVIEEVNLKQRFPAR